MIARALHEPFADRLDDFRRRIERYLTEVLQSDELSPKRLADAMRYCVLGGGKRVRPLLAYASGELGAIAPERIDAIAASLELIHAYSLIHDDLPAMDDDDLRRGKPTAHKAFDEATAILAGDALQALAFETLCCDPFLSEHPESQIRVIRRLAEAIGPSGMVGGQALDIEAENRQVSEAALEEIHRRKTGQLIRAAVMMPAELADFSADELGRLDIFANEIGLVFQIRDDLLEIDADTQALGKSAGSDADNEKSTYPSVLGVEGARARASEVHARADAALESLGERGQGLKWLSDFILSRGY